MQGEFNGFTLLASALGLFAAGFFFLSYRDIFVDFVTIVVANMMIITGMVLFYEGIRRFLGSSTRLHIVSVVSLIVGLISFIYFTYQAPSVNSRILSITAIHSVLGALCTWELAHNRQESWAFQRLATALVFACYSLYQLFRLVWTVGETPIVSFMTAGLVQALAFVAVIFLVTGSTFGFMWMVSKKLEHDLTEIAIRDPLTGILNRRGVDLLASQEIAKMDRVESEIGIIMFDIDHFKLVNDLYGHKAGDKLLKEFTLLVQMNLRSYDIFGRIGGEEFLVLLPDSNSDQALKLAERIRVQIEGHKFDIGDSKIQITASFGVSNSTQKANSLESLIPLADMALLKSKQQGKNLVTLNSPEDIEG